MTRKAKKNPGDSFFASWKRYSLERKGCKYIPKQVGEKFITQILY